MRLTVLRRQHLCPGLMPGTSRQASRSAASMRVLSMPSRHRGTRRRRGAALRRCAPPVRPSGPGGHRPPVRGIRLRGAGRRAVRPGVRRPGWVSGPGSGPRPNVADGGRGEGVATVSCPSDRGQVPVLAAQSDHLGGPQGSEVHAGIEGPEPLAACAGSRCCWLTRQRRSAAWGLGAGLTTTRRSTTSDTLSGFQLSRSRGFEGISSSSTAQRTALASTERLLAIVVAPAARPSGSTQTASSRRRERRRHAEGARPPRSV